MQVPENHGFALRFVEIHGETDETRYVWRIIHAATGNPAVDSRHGVIESYDKHDMQLILEELNDGDGLDKIQPDAAPTIDTVQDTIYETVHVGDLRPGERIAVGRRGSRKAATVKNARVRMTSAGQRNFARTLGIIHLVGQEQPHFVEKNARIRMATRAGA
jgi:hypothetical protein